MVKQVNMLKFTLLTILISIIHLAHGTFFHETPPKNCNENCYRNPFGDKLIRNYSLAEVVYQSPSYNVLVEYTSLSRQFFSSACNTYISIDGNSTFLLFRYILLTNGTEVLHTFLLREIYQYFNELVGFLDFDGPNSRVQFQYLFAVACAEQPKTRLFGLYTPVCYDVSSYGSPARYLVLSLNPHPPASCVKEVYYTMLKGAIRAGLPVPFLVNAQYARPYKCVSKYNGKYVINAASIPKENSVEL